MSSREPDVRVHVFLDAKRCTLYLDTSGEPLFKRGRRDQMGEAPLKKNLAAGILRLAGWTPDQPLLDPMCGAGTFLIEAAEMSLGLRSRPRPRLRLREAHALRRGGLGGGEGGRRRPGRKPVEPLPIHGSDLYGRTLGQRARSTCATRASRRRCSLKQANLLELSAPAPRGILVTNPPYGVRLGEKEELAKFYPELGHLLKQRFAGWTAYIFSGDPDLPKLIRLPATKHRALQRRARVPPVRVPHGRRRQPTP